MASTAGETQLRFGYEVFNETEKKISAVNETNATSSAESFTSHGLPWIVVGPPAVVLLDDVICYCHQVPPVGDRWVSVN